VVATSPARAPKACSVIGCSGLVRDGGSRCPDHKQPNRPTGSWGTQRTSGPEWRAERKRILLRDNGTCQLQMPGCTQTATSVDHTLPRAAGGSNEDENLAAACDSCHRKKTGREARWWQHQQGPPPWPDDPALKEKGPPPPPTPRRQRTKREPAQPITSIPKPIIMQPWHG